MHILVVSQHYYPDQFRINEICSALVKRGHVVDVITALPDYTTSHIPHKYKSGKNRNEIYEGVNIHRVSSIERGNGAIKRFLNYISFAVSGWVYSSRHQQNFDVAMVYQTSPVTMAIPAIKACKKYNRKMLIYCCDVWPESTKAMNLHKLPFLYNIVHKISKKIYATASIIAVSSKPFIKYLSEINDIPQQRITYIPQHGEDMLKTTPPFSDKYKDNYNFLFAGNIGKIQNVECIIHAANKIKNLDNIKIHIVGDGSNFDSIKNLVSTMKLEHMVILHGRHPIESMPAFYSMADCFILTLTGDSFIGMTLPAKLQGYMSMGKPIVGSIDGSANELINSVGCGICVEAGDVDGFSQALKKVSENREFYSANGKNARTYYKNHFTLDSFLDNLENQLKLICK